MMTEESNMSNQNLTAHEKRTGNNVFSYPEMTMSLEENVIMEKYDTSVQNILELFSLLGAAYWKLCQVSYIIQHVPNGCIDYYHFRKCFKLLVVP